MKRISYAETILGTDERVGDLLLEYAAVLARSNSADTVTLPCTIDGRAVEPVSILVGPASQIAAWTDEDPFDGDVRSAIADLEQRIEAAGGGAGPSDEPIGPGAIDDFDDLA